jgi:amino acid adenylation domain-containing protein
MRLNRTIHEVFAAVAKQWPGRTAICGDGSSLTYAELEKRAASMTTRLIAGGVRPGTKIGLYAQRSGDAVAAMLGILQAGAAYVPFDPSYPPNLLRFIAEDCAPAIMLVQRALHTAQPPFWSGETWELESALSSAETLVAPAAAVPSSVPAVDGEALAYVMYTSGSTGHPKGVLVPHRGVTRLVIDNPFVSVGPDEVHLQLAPLAFDASTFEIWGALLNGGRLAIVTNPHPSLDDIATAILEQQVTTLWLTAGLFHLMVDHRLAGLRPLRQLLAGGDVLSPPHVVKALRELPDCRIINGYGPTENTTFTCCYTVPRAQSPCEPIPIGRPIAGTTVYVLDEAGEPVADGEDGELYAGGAGVALGYLNRPELTAQRFLVDPFEGSGARLMYRTGDRVCRRADGLIEFLGRVDRQVKINGKRVELDEIEACLRRSGLIEDAAVTSSAAAGGPRRLHAYVKSSREGASLIPELRRYLREELPEHMVPASFMILPSLPLSPTGKIDRARLPAPPDLGTPSRPLPDRPAATLEATLTQIWCDVLGRREVGNDENFFDLGGTSLQLIQVHATIRSMLNSDLTVVELFQYPRIKALAGALARKTSAQTLGAAGTLSALDRAQRQRAALARMRPRDKRSV